ncbi:cdc25-like protein phosphatase twine [Drosophila kikkawai]|uniref:protein-tyrosine-phosphatase n=1 Tax=Drosophila kikkawai TaxID=30033 RepID=A0A6P4INL1_DROKI|nr:cdc25-like protein phosphatase twine [Drosophila kikkawai]
MASKRLMLDFEVGEDGETARACDQVDESQESVAPQAAKRVKGPLGTPLQRLLKSSGSTILSPITELAQNMRGARLEAGGGGGTPKSTQRSFHSTSSRALSSFNSYDSGNSLDDEYMAMFELEEDEDQQLGLPGNLELLITGQLKAEQQQQQHPEKGESQKRSLRRCLSLFPSEDDSQEKVQGPTPSTRKLQRKTLSMNDADIMTALGDEPELIGDLSKPCALPCLLTGTRHRDLKTISGETLARLIQGEFVEQLGTGGDYQIIDCRYPYEFLGGHIRGSRNLYTRGQIQDAFPSLTHKDGEQRRIYVFHCEFSSERAPKLLRFLRNNDRSHHASTYPTLDYPELYLLHNGYKEFYGSHADLCEPRQYVPMLSPAHNEEFRYFRAKTKSWQSGESEGGDSGIGGGSARPLRKSRSRLLYADGED